jgi:2-keto-4-pentenoate hydratase
MSHANLVQLKDYAERLRRAADTRTWVEPLRELLPGADEQAAYTVQRLNTEHAVRAGRRIVGRKIGLTARAVQQQLGVDQPDFGTLFADMILGDDEPMPIARTQQPKVETEVAVVLERDLPNPDTTLVEVIGAIAYALPAIEVVGSRIRDWDIRFVDTVADNASSGLVVLGAVPRRLDGLDLKACEMTTVRGGEVVSRGTGAACLGHPLVAATWLARKMAALGEPLRAGDLVMTGALGPMVPARPGERFEATISGLGNVVARFADD